MNITILEDRPRLMWEAVETLKTMGIYTKNIICYRNDLNKEEAYQKKIETMCNQLGVKLFLVDNDSFSTVLDEFYKDKEMVFFFDMDLLGDYSHHFLQRINVIYALKKKEMEKNDGRIWFYTTGPISAVEQINMYFPHRRIPVVRFKAKEERVILDYDFIKRELLEQE